VDDERYWSEIESIIEGGRLTVRDVLAHWPAYVAQDDLPRFLSQYELFRAVVDLPGVIVELGVFEGASLFTWAALLDVFCPFDVSRVAYGFDNFTGLPALAAEDGPAEPDHGKVSGAFRASAERLQRLAQLRNVRVGRRRVELVVGDVASTLPAFLAAHPGLRISLLHLDLDLYEPTRLGLELLYPRVVKGGVVCLDEYGLEPWAGETRAVDEYFAAHGPAPTIRKHPFTQAPHGYFIK
jgi:hypothetical protein